MVCQTDDTKIDGKTVRMTIEQEAVEKGIEYLEQDGIDLFYITHSVALQEQHVRAAIKLALGHHRQQILKEIEQIINTHSIYYENNTVIKSRVLIELLKSRLEGKE